MLEDRRLVGADLDDHGLMFHQSDDGSCVQPQRREGALGRVAHMAEVSFVPVSDADASTARRAQALAGGPGQRVRQLHLLRRLAVGQ